MIQDRPVGVVDYTPDLPVVERPADDPLAALRAFLPRRRVEPTEGMPRFTGGAVGALAYDAVSVFEPTVPLPHADPVGVPLASFIETDLVLVFDHLTHTLAAIASLHTDAPRLEERYRVAERALFEALEQTARPSAAELAGPPAAGAARAGAPGVAASPVAHAPPRCPDETSLGRDAYEAAVRNAKGAIAAGEAIQVVLARRQTIPLPARADGRPVDGIGLYRSLRKVNPSPYLFFVRTPSFEVVGASPELLLQVEGERMTTHPIAGTRPRGADAREDELLAEQLQADPKERAEHVMLVDLGRNDLGRVARPGTVRVSKYMEVERYSHVLHLVSHVEAKLAPGPRRARRAAQRLPGGHALGRPEGAGDAAHRGARRASGAGCTAARSATSATTATSTRRSRSAARCSRTALAHVHAGAGIVAGSVPEREFEETEHKAAAMRRAIELAAGVAPAPSRPGEGPTAHGRGRARRRVARTVRRGDRCAWTNRGCPMILVVDNYDSFTFNLVQALQAAGADVRVVRNDAIDRAGLDALADDPAADLRGIVVSPGPSDPEHAGISVETVRFAAERRIPLLGVCLGMQAMGAAFGAAIVRAPTLVHGEASPVDHDGHGLLAGMPAGVPGRPVPLPVHRPGDAAGRSRPDRAQRRRRGPDGDPPRDAPDGGRPVPPRVGADAGGAAPPGELPAPRRGRGGGPARRGQRVVRDPRAGRRRHGRRGRPRGRRQARRGRQSASPTSWPPGDPPPRRRCAVAGGAR